MRNRTCWMLPFQPQAEARRAVQGCKTEFSPEMLSDSTTNQFPGTDVTLRGPSLLHIRCVVRCVLVQVSWRCGVTGDVTGTQRTTHAV